MNATNAGAATLDVWVKICGITRVDDARAAFQAGADAIGLNFVGGPRRITVESARAVLEAVPGDRAAVGLVQLGADGVDPSVDEVLMAYSVCHVQMYGEVSPRNVGRLVDQGRRPLLVCRPGERGVRVCVDQAVGELAVDHLYAVVLDSAAPAGTQQPTDNIGQQGGSGRTLDWQALARARDAGEMDGLPPVVLAGGLHAENVGRAIEIVRPWGVDVSSGVEIEPGSKDHQAVVQFIRAAKGRA